MALLTLAQATRAARLTGTPTADQTAILTEMIAALGGALEPVAGPVESEPRTVYPRSLGRDLLVLPWRFETISSIVCDGTTLNPTTYDQISSAEAGIVRPVAGSTAPWASAYVTAVTAMVGYAVLPGNLAYACELLIQAWWESAWQGRGPASEAIQWAAPVGDLPPGVMQAVGADVSMAGFA